MIQLQTEKISKMKKFQHCKTWQVFLKNAEEVGFPEIWVKVQASNLLRKSRALFEQMQATDFDFLHLFFESVEWGMIFADPFYANLIQKVTGLPSI